MMARVRRAKLSSKAKELLAEASGGGLVYMEAVLAGDSEIVDEALLYQTYADRRLLLGEIANVHDDGAIQGFWRRWRRKIRPEWKQDLFAIRDELRTIWRSPISPASEGVLRKWLAWLPSSDHLRAYEIVGLPIIAKQPHEYAPFRCSVKARKLVPDFMSLRAMLIQGVFENWQHMKYCANPDCLVPYFIAKRKDQAVCDAEICKAEKQREHARKWWNEHRAKHPQSANAKKGRKENARGARKAR
jgi:hypothetical protein